MKLTKSQVRALKELSGVELGWVYAPTAAVLFGAGLIERHPTSRLTDWWSITEAGRTALKEQEQGR